MNRRSIVFGLFCLALLPAAGCDKATPVAPTGTTLTLSANPSKIALNGRSTITIVGRKPDGNPLNPGTEIRLSTDRGTIDPVVEIGEGGRATATLRADGRPGTATVTAATADASVDATVQVGESDETRPTLVVAASPNIIPIRGTSTITIIARNADGSSVTSGRVILTTTLGSLNPSQPEIRNGTATSTLTGGDQAGTATITAILGASEAETAEVTIRDSPIAISLQVKPASIPREDRNDIELIASVVNAQGQPVQGASVIFTTTRGSITPTGFVLTNSSGVATATLSVKEADLAGLNNIQVTATSFRGDGTEISQTVVVNITG